MLAFGRPKFKTKFGSVTYSTIALFTGIIGGFISIASPEAVENKLRLNYDIYPYNIVLGIIFIVWGIYDFNKYVIHFNETKKREEEKKKYDPTNDEYWQK